MTAAASPKRWIAIEYTPVDQAPIAFYLRSLCPMMRWLLAWHFVCSVARRSLRRKDEEMRNAIRTGVTGKLAVLAVLCGVGFWSAGCFHEDEGRHGEHAGWHEHGWNGHDRDYDHHDDFHDHDYR